LREPPARTIATRCCSPSRAHRPHLGDPEAIAHVRAAYEAAHDQTERAHAALAVMGAATPEPEQIEEALRLIERAADGVAGRDREVELQLEAAR
jgi:hypothetical protein